MYYEVVENNLFCFFTKWKNVLSGRKPAHLPYCKYSLPRANFSAPRVIFFKLPDPSFAPRVLRFLARTLHAALAVVTIVHGRKPGTAFAGSRQG